MTNSTLETLNHKKYVEEKDYDKILYALRDSNAKNASLEREIKEREAEKEQLQEKLKEYEKWYDNLQFESRIKISGMPPISVAKELIESKVYLPKNENWLIERNQENEVPIFKKSELRQIAEHLLVYCNNYQEEDR